MQDSYGVIMTQERGRREGGMERHLSGGSCSSDGANVSLRPSSSVSLQQLECFYHSKVTAAAHVTEITTAPI